MKRFLSALLSAAFLSTFAGCSMVSDVEDKGESLIDSAQSAVSDIMSADNSSKTRISEERAQEIALKDAGQKKEDVHFIKSELDKEATGEKYEIDFSANGREYEYDIDAYSGEILSVEKD